MQTVIDKETGAVLYCFFEETEIAENEIIINEIATDNFYNFKTRQFYHKEIDLIE